jgi:hypothetical protein
MVRKVVEMSVSVDSCHVFFIIFFFRHKDLISHLLTVTGPIL